MSKSAFVGEMGSGCVASDKLAYIERAVAGGLTVYLCTYTRATKITPKVWGRFQAANRPLLKVSHDPHGSSLWLSQGRSYVCADYCAITVEDAS